MQIYLAVTPDKQREAARFTERLAHVAYRIGRDGRLTRQALLARTHGGMMVLGDLDSGAIRDTAALCRDVWRECGNRGFGGVLADFEQGASADRVAFLDALSRVLSRNGKQLFVPESYGAKLPQAHVLICTALSGGELRQRLAEAARTFGGKRLALDLQRLRMSFPLPCPTGDGTPLTGEELDTLMGRRQPVVFYSNDLCAKYFTATENGESRFVLFDDAGSIRKKLQLARQLDIGEALLPYAQVDDLLPELLGG